MSAVLRDNSNHMRQLADQGEKDTRLMAEIAIDTKRDSAAMKTISILTLVYLPSAFVVVRESTVKRLG